MKSVCFSGLPCVIILLIFLASSCKSPVRFKYPQPSGSQNKASFPREMQGSYISEDSTAQIVITKEQVLKYYAFDFSQPVDTVKRYFDFEDSFIVQKQSDEKFKYLSKNDSIFWREETATDTIFSIANGDVLRKFRGHYFLNHLDSAGWSVTRLGLKQGRLEIADIKDSADIRQLRELTKNPGDSTFVFNPSRRQFKKYLRSDGFNDREIFYKVN